MFLAPGDRAQRRLIKSAAIDFIIDGGGSAIAAALYGYVQLPFPCTITSVELLADRSGSITVDIWRCSYSQFDAGSTHPVVGDSITASDTPALSSATKMSDSNLTGWSVKLNKGDILGFNVTGVTSVQRISVILNLVRS